MSQLEEIKAELESVKADRDKKADACRYMGEIIERQGKWVVAATSSQDLIGEDGDGDWEGVWDRVIELRRERDRQTKALEAVENLLSVWDEQFGDDANSEDRLVRLLTGSARQAIREALA